MADSAQLAFTLPTKVTCHLKAYGNAVHIFIRYLFIQAVMEAHETRSRALSGLRSKFHTARPWQKKVEANLDTPATRNVAESSEEEMEQVCSVIEAV